MKNEKLSGRTLRDIRDAQRNEAKRFEDQDPELAAKLKEWADYLDDVIARGKELLG